MGSVAGQISIDLRLPTTQVNPWWYGSISLKINAPSLGLYSVTLGQTDLTGSPLGTFKRFAFTLPPDVKAKLSGSYTDLTFTVALNVPAGNGPYFLDRLDTGAASSASPTPQTCVPGGRCLLLVHLPRGLSIQAARFVSESGIALADRTQVSDENGQPGLIASNGGTVSLGVEAHSGDIFSLDAVTLSDRAVVDGSIHALGTVTVGGGQVTGSIIKSPELRPLGVRSWSIKLPANFGAGIDLQRDQVQTLAPGAFGDIAVKSGATLTLASGVYYLSSLTLETQATLRLDQTGGPVYLYVLHSFTHRGTIVSVDGTAPNLLVGYLGDAPVKLEAPFSGTFVAPNALLTLGSVLPTQYSGAFFAKSLSTEAGAQVKLLPSPIGDLVDDNLSECAQGIQLDPALPEPLRTQQANFDLLKFCLAPGIDDCEAKLMAIANSDRHALALQFLASTKDAPEHLAVTRDITRKVHAMQRNPARLAQYCEGDADGDRVPDALDHCPGTPPLTATDDVGCTSLALPKTATRQVLEGLLSRQGIIYNPKCNDAAPPATPIPNSLSLITSGNFGTASLGVKLGVLPSQLAPTGCEVWVETHVYFRHSRRHFEMAFELKEPGVTIDDAILRDLVILHMTDRTPGARGELARDMIAAGQNPPSPNRDLCDAMVSARVTNGNGTQSAWSSAVPLNCGF